MGIKEPRNLDNSDKVLQWMQRREAESLHFHRRATFLYGDGAALPVGGAFFDEVIKAEARRVFVARIRAGDNPKQALDTTLSELRKYVVAHNARRSKKDYTWHHHEDHGADIAHYLYRDLTRSMQNSAKELGPIDARLEGRSDDTNGGRRDHNRGARSE